MVSSSNSKSRITVVSLAFSLVALGILGRLFQLQVVRGDEFSSQVSKGTIGSSTSFDRGTIYFSQKDGTLVSAATTVRGFTLVAERSKVGDVDTLLQKLGPIVEFDTSAIKKRYETSPSRHVELLRKITQSQADEIKALGIDGVAFRPDRWRFYPGGSIAAHTLGFVAFAEDSTLDGRYGVERFYNKTLQREPEEIYGNFFTHVFANINETISGGEEEADVITTLEPQVQQKLDSYLRDALNQYDADGAGAIILDPKTGAVLAMNHLPEFDLNDFGNVSSATIYSNPNVESVFEFGSVMKPLVMAAAIDVGAVNAGTTYNDKGSLTLNNKTIHNFDKKARGQATMQDVLNQSLNTGMVFVMQTMGRENFKKYMLAYGIDEKTGIDLPNETKGLVSNLKSNREIEYATASFGQGIALTPIEAVRAFSSLANGGSMVSPRISSKLQEESGDIVDIEKPAPVQVIRKESADEITRMLVTVVDKGLNGGQYKNEHYSIAAKTGTAQMAMENGRGYYEDRYLHSLFGYYPAYNPKFLVLMYMENPKGVRFAGASLADPFFEMSKFLLSYYEVAPDR